MGAADDAPSWGRANDPNAPDANAAALKRARHAGAACCFVAFLFMTTFSAGGWKLIFSAGTTMEMCEHGHSHQDGPQLFEDVCVGGGTEAPFTSQLLASYDGVGGYRCACCGQPLFPASTKFRSGTGWPSFSAPVEGENVIGYGKDVRGMFSSEVHCGHCGAHLGHVFDDGEGETGYRYCINGVCLRRDLALELPADNGVPWVPNTFLILGVACGGIFSGCWLCCHAPWSRALDGLDQCCAPATRRVFGSPDRGRQDAAVTEFEGETIVVGAADGPS